MKKFILVAIVSFLFGTSSFAQGDATTLSPKTESVCTEITRTMARELHLNEMEYIKLKDINRERLVKTEELVQASSENAAALKEGLREIEVSYEQKLATFLTPKQQTAYANYKKETARTQFMATSH